MSFQNALRPFFPFFHVALFLGGRKLLLLNWVCCLLVHGSSMITRDLSTGEGRDLLSLRSVWLFSSYLSLWVSHSPLRRGENCLHLGNLFIKQKFSQEKRDWKRKERCILPLEHNVKRLLCRISEALYSYYANSLYSIREWESIIHC